MSVPRVVRMHKLTSLHVSDFEPATCAKMLIYGKFSLFLENVAVSCPSLSPLLDPASSRCPEQWVFTLGLSASSALDILLTGMMLHYLRKSRTGFPKYAFYEVSDAATKLRSSQ